MVSHNKITSFKEQYNKDNSGGYVTTPSLYLTLIRTINWKFRLQHSQYDNNLLDENKNPLDNNELHWSLISSVFRSSPSHLNNFLY